MNIVENIVMDRATSGVALASATTPWWLPNLQTVSDSAALALPILGVVWLLVQIGAKVYTTFRKN